jgi:hypothetical protein
MYPTGGCREEEPVGPRHRRTAGSSQDGEFMPKHDDFQLFEIVRPNAQGRELEHPPKYYVTERRNTNRPGSLTPALFYASASDSRFHVAPNPPGYESWINGI